MAKDDTLVGLTLGLLANGICRSRDKSSSRENQKMLKEGEPGPRIQGCTALAAPHMANVPLLRSVPFRSGNTGRGCAGHDREARVLAHPSPALHCDTGIWAES